MTTIHTPERRRAIQLSNEGNAVRQAATLFQNKINSSVDAAFFSNTLDKIKINAQTDSPRYKNIHQQSFQDFYPLKNNHDVAFPNKPAHGKNNEERVDLKLDQCRQSNKYDEDSDEVKDELSDGNEKIVDASNLLVMKVFLEEGSHYSSYGEMRLAIEDTCESNQSSSVSSNTFESSAATVITIDRFMHMFEQLHKKIDLLERRVENQWHFTLQDSHLPIVGLTVKCGKSNEWSIGLHANNIDKKSLSIYCEKLKERVVGAQIVLV